MMLMITLLGAVGAAIGAFKKELSSLTRGLVCWTSACVSLILCAVIFFAGSGEFSVDFHSLPAGAVGFGVFVVLVLLTELCAPSRRFAKQPKQDFDARAAERALNLVLVIVVCSLAFFGLLAELFGELYLTGICIVPAAALSVRQLSYFLWLAKDNPSNEQTAEKQRAKLLRMLSSGKNKL